MAAATPVTVDVNDKRSRERTSEQKERCTLFVGDLARGVTENELCDLFESSGEVIGVEVKRDRSSGNNLGYGFVEFRTRKQAEDAKLKLDRHELRGRRVRLGWAHKSTCLFMYDLDPTVTTEEFQSICCKFGDIIPEATFVRLNQGFVRFVHRSDAEAAKAYLDGTCVESSPASSRHVRILWGEACLRSIFFQFSTENEFSHRLNESVLEAEFQKYGDIDSLRLCRDQSAALRGFGFVNYSNSEEGEAAASAAIEALDKSTIIDQVTLSCYYGRKQGRSRRISKKTSSRTSSISSDQTSMPVACPGSIFNPPNVDVAPENSFYATAIMPMLVHPAMSNFNEVCYFAGGTTYYPYTAVGIAGLGGYPEGFAATMSGSSA